MNGRAVAWVLLVLVVVVGGGLWWRVFELREEGERYQAERLTGRPVDESKLPAIPPAAEEALAPAAGAAAAATAPVQRSTPVLGGAVLRAADDSPLEGAIVEVLGAPGPDGRPPVLCLTNTVADGRFVITAPGVEAAALRIWFAVGYRPAEPPPAGHPGFRLGECVVQTVPLTADAQRLDLTVRVDTGWVVWGTVSDTTGKPLAGGTVTVVEPHAYSVVDTQGQYRIRDLPPDAGPLSLMATGMRVRGATVELPPPPTGERLVQFDIQLEPAGLIFGKVEWKRSTPRPLMPPVIAVVNAPAGTFDGPRPGAVDGAGNYQIDGLAEGSWDLSCGWSTIVGDTQRTYTVYARSIAVAAGASVQHDFLLPGDAALDVRVTGADGAPQAGLRVELCHVLDPTAPEAPVLSEVFGATDADGRCALTDLAPGAKELRILTQPELQAGVAPAMPERLATQRLELADGPNAVTVVVGAR